MNDQFIIVKARLVMKTTEEGGKTSGFYSGYRPNHVFEMPENMNKLITYIGEIQFDDEKLVMPGETKVVNVRFLNHPGIQAFIQVGRSWYINEARRTVGMGEILELL